MNKLHLLLVACLMLGTPASGATYYLDPAAGSLTNTGDAAHPWSGLAQVVAAGLIQAQDQAGVWFNTNGPVRGGDQLFLRTGYHGDVVLNGYYLERTLAVAAEPGHTPTLKGITLRGGSHWALAGLEVSPVHGPGESRGPIVGVLNHQRHGPARWVSVENCRVSSVPDVSAWITTNQWLDLARDGIVLQGDHCRAVSNHVRNVAWGIQLGGVSNYAGYNLIENFRGDGLRTVNHYGVAEFNTIRNAYLVDGNHMDGIQGFYRNQPGREVRGIVIRGNVILRHQRLEDPFVSPYLQGIGFFDGPFVDCVFEDNVVEADSYHGLSVYNAQGCRLTGNTVGGDAGTNLVDEGRIVLGCKVAYGQVVRDNVLASNVCDRFVIATQAVGTVLSDNVIRPRGRGR